MKVIITKDYARMSAQAALIAAEIIERKPDAVLGLATGSTPIGMYSELIRMYEEGRLSFKNVKTVNLDEYVGLGREDVQSYVYFMNENLFNRIDVDKSNTHLPNGKAVDLQAECARYSALLSSLGRDLQVLGLGSNGHIGFNEPGTPFSSVTHVVNLTENTITDNSRLFARREDVPKTAITMGVSEILRAERILMLASGKNKARAVYRAVKGEVSEDCPASVLQTHKDAVLVLDEQAASLL